jgi:hypothetical protein
LAHAKKRPSSPEVNSTKAGQPAATKLWNAVGGFGFLSAIAVIAGMASEKIAPDTFKLTDLDSHSITLFAIPLLACVVIAESIIGAAYVRACKPKEEWSKKIPPIVEGLSRSSLRRYVSAIVLFAFVMVPWFGAGAALSKFFSGSYYYAKVASSGCDPQRMSVACETMGSGLKHFRPKYGVGSLTNTPYRYEGNKTYIPVIFPTTYLLLFAAACFFAFRNCLSIFVERPQRASPK